MVHLSSISNRTRRSQRGTPSDPIRDETLIALDLIMEPLIELMFDAGLTIREFNKLVRDKAVRTAIKRLTEHGSKGSQSGAAIITGLPRSEVAKILKSPAAASAAKSNQLPARRVLSAWNYDPSFTTATGRPSVLPIYGRSASFEQLVLQHAGGIPVRAMLDELTQLQAIERLPNQRVKARPQMKLSGLTRNEVATVGQRCRDLLRTLAHNRNEQAAPLFHETAVSNNISPDMISFVSGEISREGAKLAVNAQALLTEAENRKNSSATKSGTGCRLGVTIYVFNDLRVVADHNKNSSPRKNLRRQSRNARK